MSAPGHLLISFEYQIAGRAFPSHPTEKSASSPLPWMPFFGMSMTWRISLWFRDAWMPWRQRKRIQFPSHTQFMGMSTYGLMDQTRLFPRHERKCNVVGGVENFDQGAGNPNALFARSWCPCESLTEDIYILSQSTFDRCLLSVELSSDFLCTIE